MEVDHVYKPKPLKVSPGSKIHYTRSRACQVDDGNIDMLATPGPSNQPPTGLSLTNEFKCQICDKEFPTLTSMVIHQDTHILINPFKCDQCSKVFFTPNQLKRHKKRRDVKCAFCGNTFCNDRVLAKHLCDVLLRLSR